MKANVIILLLAGSLLSNCRRDPVPRVQADDFFHVEEMGAFLPVWVRGNTASNKILVYIQGGPGSNTLDFARVDYPGWENTLERDYAVAYYDQRGTGNKQGTFDLETVSMAQYATDLHKILLALRHRYPQAQLYLFGHSFGASLVYEYLIRYGDASAAAASIAFSGPATHDYQSERWVFRRQYLINAAEEQLARGQDTDFWREVLQWTEANSTLDTPDQQRQWNRYVSRVAVEADVRIPVANYLDVVFFSPYNVFASYLSGSKEEKVVKKLFEDINTVDIFGQLGRINQPILLITGRYDDIAPPEEMQAVYERLASARKELVVIPDAGHDVYLDQPERFREAVDGFLER